MADNVPINTGTAVTVAAEDVGGTQYQRIKIVDGGAAGTLGVVATSAAPAAGTVGLVVRVAGTVGLAPTAMTVNTVSVGNLGTVDVTTGGLPANSSTGLIVALKQGGIVIAQISAGATVVAQISSTVLSVNTAPTVAGASVTIQQGASVSALVSISASAILGTVVTVSAVGTVTVVNSVSTVGSIGVVNSVSTVGSVGVVNSVSTVGGTVVVTVATAGSITALDVARTQWVLMVSSTSPSNAGMLLFTVYLGTAQAANTAGVSLFAIPAGKVLRIVNLEAVAAGSVSALVGQVQVIFATSAATVTVSAIGGRGAALAIAGATTVFSVWNNDPNCEIPATQTVGVGISLNTSCLLGGVIVNGYLFP